MTSPSALRHPGALALSATLTALALVPLIYLAVRASGAEGGALLALARPEMARLAGRSLALAVSTSALATTLALALAVMLQAADMPAKRLLSAFVVLPFAIPCYVGASAYVAGLSPSGPVGALIAQLGFKPPTVSGFGWSTLVLALYTVPIAFLPIRAALARANGELYDAARNLGRSPMRALGEALRPVVPTAARGGAALVALYALGEFGAVSLFRYDAFPRVIYQQYLSQFDRSAAAVSALGLALVVGAVLLLAERGQKPIGAQVRPRPLHFRLGRARPLALAGLGSYVIMAVGVPVASIVWWTAHAGIDTPVTTWRALRTTAFAAALATPPAVLLALSAALLAHRTPTGRILARIADTGFAMPGLVVALGFVVAALSIAPPLYQSWAVYSLAMVVLFAPLAVASTRGALATVSATTEEAALTLGSGPRAVFRRITLPIALPGVLAGAALVAISTMKELSASLLLLPTGESTLATRLWSATEEVRYAEAALPALLLICLAGLAAFVADRRPASNAG